MEHIKEQITSVLDSIEGNGSFMAEGAKDILLPGLQVSGEDVGLPVTSLQAQALIQMARQAPFGKGEETVTDTKVRNTWEIDAAQVAFKNPKWKSFMKKLLKEVQAGFGIEGQKVRCELYKLLVYEEGGFFLPHKDSEKADGMFASLVLGLPSTHTGGEFMVRFDGREEVIDFSAAAENFEIPYVAFYADCEHEIKPVTSGYRVCLVYNLLQVKGSLVAPIPQFSTQTSALTELLKEWAVTTDRFPKAILLGHEYTPANFSRMDLKHHDRPRAEALLAAAVQAGFYAELGLVTHYIMGDLESDEDYYDSYRYRRRGYSSWKDEDEEVTGKMGTDIYEEYTKIEYWGTDDGPKLGMVSLDMEDVVTKITIGEGNPTEQEAEGYTGNAGMTMEYWYHYGAVVLWPHSSHVSLLEKQPINIKLDWIRFYLEHWDDPRYESQKLVMQLFSAFVEQDFKYSWYRDNGEDFEVIADALVKVEDEVLFKAEGPQVLDWAYDQLPVSKWLGLFATYEHRLFGPIFERIGTRGDIFLLHHLLGILEALIEIEAPDYRPFILAQIKLLPTYLHKAQLHRITRNQNRRESDKPKPTIKALFSQTLTLSQWKAEDKKWEDLAFNSLTQSLPRKYVNEIMVPALLAHSQKANPLYLRLLDSALEDLAKRTAKKPQPPKTWKMKVPKGNRYTQETWELLADFLQSPTETSVNYKANQGDRQEVEKAIRNAKIDLKTRTIEKGRPYTLRIMKTQASYELKLKKWKEDVELEEKWNK